jgi:hypothetical protein
MEAKAREFHGHDALLAGRESPCRDNTIEGNVGVWASRFWRLRCDDNGDGGAGGQPPAWAFPKAFAWVKRLLRGLPDAHVTLGEKTSRRGRPCLVQAPKAIGATKRRESVSSSAAI